MNSAALFPPDAQVRLPGTFSATDYEILLDIENPRVRAIRATLEKWFSQYALGDDDSRTDLARRFQTGQRSGFFELYVHELLVRLGHTVAVEPRLETTEKRPDFLATVEGGSQVIVEAVEAWEQGRQPVERKRSHLWDVLDKFSDPDVAIMVEGDTHLADPPPPKAIAAFLRRMLKTVDVADLRRLQAKRGLAGLPRWPFPESGCAFVPVPKGPGFDRGFVGHFETAMRDIDWPGQVRQAVLDKAGKYGDLGIPLIIALDLARFDVPDMAVEWGLFGQVVTRIPQIGNTIGPEYEARLPDGAWTTPGRSARTRVSAVLTFKDPTPFRIGAVQARLWENPWAMHRYDGPLRRFPQSIVTNWMIQETVGVSDRDVLGLSEDWLGLRG